MVIRKIVKRYLTPLLQKAHKRYFSVQRTHRIQKVKITVLPGVFPPQLVFSSKILLEFLSTLDLNGKKFLDLGSGSGLLAVQAAKLGADVTAVDINEAAIENTRLNAEKNVVSIYALESDLFENIKQPTFEVVVINPPYYPAEPKNVSEKAWYCGENFEYFERLFGQIKERKNNLNEIYMILSEDCQIKTITEIAGKFGIKMTLKNQVKKWWETNYIFKLT